MGTGYLIDSNIVIGCINDRLPKKGMSFMHPIIDDVPNISLITKIEVLRFNAPEETYRILSDFMDNSVIYDLSHQIVDRTILLGKASKIKLPDAIIAATALTYDFILLTRNVSDFKTSLIYR
jgi:predicted nucleic acid-binding protein